jgi:hypothetical protein
MISRAKQEAESYFHVKKDAVATTMNDVVEATRQFAKSLREREDSTVARYTESVADQVEELTHYVETLNPQKAIRDLEDVARRQPLLFYGGLFLAGVALSRFLRASDRSDASDKSPDEPSNFSNMAYRTTESGRRGGAYAGTPTI